MHEWVCPYCEFVIRSEPSHQMAEDIRAHMHTKHSHLDHDPETLTNQMTHINTRLQ